MERMKYIYEQANKPFPPMLQSKAFVFLLKWFAPPLYVFAFIANMDSWKADFLFIVALIFGGIRFYYWVETKKLLNRSRDLDNEIKELGRKKIEREFNRDE